MLKTIKPGFLLACCILLVSCSTGRIKFGPKYEVAKTKVDKAEVIAEIEPEEQVVETPLAQSDIASASNDVDALFIPAPTAPVTTLDSTQQQTTEQENATDKRVKKKKEPSVFKRGMQLSGLSSGILAIATTTFFLSGISVYFPVVGILLCIVGIYFFVRGLGSYLAAKRTLQWYPQEYAKAQKYGWATTILIINFIMLAAALVGLLTLIF